MAKLPRVKRTDLIHDHAQRLRATPSPWDIKQESMAKFARESYMKL